MAKQDKITIRGAREHNLKNINVEIPKNKLVIFTGLSGSGKSSLAHDTIYAEGQRRYVESLSAYARQFLGIMGKPDVDAIEGLSPAISIDQKSTSHNPRSTVGTVTEIYDYLRLLFARIGHPHCQVCGREIKNMSSQQIVDAILQLIKEWSQRKKQVMFMVLAPVVRDRKGEFTGLFNNIRQKGYTRLRVDGQIFGIDEDLVLIKTNKHTIEVVVDRLSLATKQLKSTVSIANLKTRLTEAVENSLKLSEGLVVITEINDATFSLPDKPKKTVDHLYSEHFACPVDNISLPEIEPRTFSFNSPHGACPTCNGIGSLLKIDPELVINPNLSINEGGILPFSRMIQQETWFARILKTAAQAQGLSADTPLGQASNTQLKVLLEGTGDRIWRVEGKNRYGRLVVIHDVYPGVIPELERRYAETESDYLRAEIEKYMRRETCPACHGARLKDEALAITVGQKSIVEVTSMSVKDCFVWLKNLQESDKVLSPREKVIASLILKEVIARLNFLVAVGLDYLTLDRAATTMAGGESQRIRLASQIGSGLTGVLYILDEPSIGLHQRDNQRLINTLKKLRDLGNTVIVVEHDREMMEQADWIADFGPGAGDEGGRIVAYGPVRKIKQAKTLTGEYLRGRKKISLKRREATSGNGVLILKRARQHNLKQIDVSFPLGNFICITGVSGSGKSTLVDETLYHELARRLHRFHREKPGANDGLEGVENIDKVILIDQSPIGRTPRSNPATYSGAFTYVRQLFAKTADARVRGYRPGRFSFNVAEGRCRTCEGEGQIKIEMQFLPDVYVDCEVCQGRRYNAETLEVAFRGKNIAEVLDMTVAEANQFFTNIPLLAEKLRTLVDVGLGYIGLGQPAPTLSGGEAQRVKLATELGKKATGKTFYILDEPTTGLHFEDLKNLLNVLHRLVERGNTVVIIEHNLDVIKNADWIIDLGPEGGEAGGFIVAQGPPEQVAKVKNSYTGQFLKKVIGDRLARRSPALPGEGG